MTPDEFFTSRLHMDRDISRMQGEIALLQEELRKLKNRRIKLITDYARERCYGTD